MNTFYTDKRVVITGGAGMVGALLVQRLLGQGAHVTVSDNFSRGGGQRVARAHYIHSDAGHMQMCREVFRDAFAVFNLAAAVAGVEYNQHNHMEQFARNVRLQTTPLEAASAEHIPHVLQVSSVCVYSPDHNHPAQEEHGHAGEPHSANNGYAWAKRMGERAAVWADLEHVVIVRPSNLYGPGDVFDHRAHVIPALIRKALRDEEIVVNGSGQERREFLYAADAADGMLFALEHGQHREAYNLGTNGATCVTIAALLGHIQEATGATEKPVRFTSAYDPGDPARRSDCTRLGALGWGHTTALKKGIAQTVRWYQGAQ